MSVIRRVPGAVGVRAARAFAAASSQYLEAATGFGLGANDPFYFLVRARRDASTSNQCLVQLGRTGGSANDSRGLLTVGASTVSARSITATGTNGTATSAASAFTSGAGWYSLIAEFGGSASRRIIVDGVAVSNSTSRALTNAPDVLRVGVDLAGTTPFTGGLSQLAIFAGTASDALIAAHRLGVHPTQLPGRLLECWDLDRVGPIVGLVRRTVLSPVNGGSLTAGPAIQGPPRSARIFVPSVGGATNYTLSADSGSVAATGTAAGTLYSRVLSAASGAVAATGTAAAALYLRILTALTAAATITGQSASALWNRLVSAASGAWEATGTAASTLWARVTRAETATVDLTGQSATLTYSGGTGPSVDEKRKTFMLMGIYK